MGKITDKFYFFPNGFIEFLLPYFVIMIYGILSYYTLKYLSNFTCLENIYIPLNHSLTYIIILLQIIEIKINGKDIHNFSIFAVL